MTDTCRGLSAARNTVFSLLNEENADEITVLLSIRLGSPFSVPCMGYANDMVNVAQRKLE